MSKYYSCLVVAMCLLNGLLGQRAPDFKPLRYDEDYNYLQHDTSENWYHKIKRGSLGKNPNSYISFGGEMRFQYFTVKNENWGDEPADKDGYSFSRWLLHTDVHIGKNFRTFVQLQSSMANSKISTSPVDEDPLEIHQAFSEILLHPGVQNKINLRVGRQEFSYGSQRLVSVRDGPNNRQSFDALKLGWSSKNYKSDIFYSHYVAARKNIFDDRSNDNIKFWGNYWVINKIPVIQNIDLYYFGLFKRNTNFDDGTNRELRQSFGTRIWGKQGQWRYDAEALTQFGKFGDKKIRAWTASLNSSFTLGHTRYEPQFGIKTELISGDKKYGDNKLQTFNPLFPRGGYFGLAAIIGPSNLMDIHPSVSFKLNPKLDWSVDYDIFWRYSKNDGLYAPSTKLIYSGKNSIAKYVGNQLSSELTFIPVPYIYMRAELTWFKAGKYLQEVSEGKNIFFTGITLQAKF